MTNHKYMNYPIFILIGLCLAFLALATTISGSKSFAEGQYEFVAPPGSVNRIFRVDIETGQVGACQYQNVESNNFGRTLCFGSGKGAGPQGRGFYGLVSSNHETEKGVIRVERNTGAMSFCWISDGLVVCTAQKR